MAKAPIVLTYLMNVDEHGVFDGRDLAESLIRDAYKLLIPYTQACPDCSDTLFAVIARSVIEEIQDRGQLSGTIMAVWPEDKELRFNDHKEARQGRTDRLLENAGVIHRSEGIHHDTRTSPF